jgi:zeaxanthin glucosyltransferase
MERKRALILMASHVGHYNATFKLSNSLLNLNYEIVYAGEKRFKKLVEGNGFPFVEFPFVNTFHDYGRLSFGLAVKTFFANYKMSLVDSRYKTLKAEITLLEHLIAPYDMIFLDSFLFMHTYVLYRQRKKLVLLETMLSRVREEFIPPLNSRFRKFASACLSRLMAQTQWELNFLSSKMFFMARNVMYFGQSRFSLVERYLKSDNVRLSMITEKNRCFYKNLKGVKEIVLSPKSIDFPWRTVAKNQHFYEAQRSLVRYDADPDDDVLALLNILKANSLSRSCKVIYCSLGSIAYIHFNHHEQFLQKIICVFENMKNTYLIIAAGNKKIKLNLNTEFSNVFVLEKVPQLDILTYTDLFISHGGLNSIIEAIQCNTPLLVYPLNDRWDQIGNSSRVAHHGIGLSGNIYRDGEDKILRDAEMILGRSMSYKKALLKLHGAFVTDEIANSELANFLRD